jgi:hypothetical protein
MLLSRSLHRTGGEIVIQKERAEKSRRKEYHQGEWHMNPKRRIAIVTAALLLGLGVVATFLSSQTPVAEAGQWCGQSCSRPLPPTPKP